MSNVQHQPTPQMQAAPGKVVYRDFGAGVHTLGSDEKRNWTYGLMDCFGRCGLCCWASICPCIVFSKTKQRQNSLQYEGHPIEGGGSRCNFQCCIYAVVCGIGHPWIKQVLPRMEMRERYHIRGQMMNDFFVSFFCNPCALTQERREVEEEEKCYRESQ